MLALATATLITYPNLDSDQYIKKLKDFGDNLYFLIGYFILIFGFLVFASVMGLITTNNTQEFSPNRLIQLSKSVETQSCSFPIRDFDRGGVHLSQMLDGYTTYIRNQIESDEPLVETDYDVMKWYLCAVDEVIATKKGSIELVNADINTVSYFSSIEPSVFICLFISGVSFFTSRTHIYLCPIHNSPKQTVLCLVVVLPIPTFL